jgi:CrcB protein
VAFGAVGVAAAYTTFSTFTLDTFELIMSRSWAAVTAYALLSIGGGVAVASVGHRLGERP